LLSAAHSSRLQTKGYAVLLADYPARVKTFGLCLAASADYTATHSDAVRDITQTLIEARAFALADKNRNAVMRAFASWLNIIDPDTASNCLSELNAKPYPSLAALAKMQSVMAMHEPRVMQVRLEAIVDDQIVRNLDESGTIEQLYATHGASISS
jgi:hypothetical protein